MPLNKQLNGKLIVKASEEICKLLFKIIQKIINGKLCVFSYLAVHSSSDAVRVLCRRGDQPSLRTALQVN